MDPTIERGKDGPSRRVADMDIEKLYRKRAIDRENQRNLRSKNKQRIQQLEEELSQVKQELEESQREASRLSGKGMATRTTISSIIRSLQALEKEGDLSPDATDTEASLRSTHVYGQPQLFDPDMVEPMDEPTTHSAFDPNLWLNGGSVSFPDSAFPDLPDFSFDLSHLLSTQSPNSHVESSSFTPSLTADPSRIPDDVFHAGRRLANTLRGEGHVWNQLPQYCAPTCHGDAWMTDLMESRKSARDAAKNAAEFSNRNFPSINSLVNPSISESDTPVASTVAKHLTGIVRVYTLPEKIALLYVISHLLRWQIMPCEESYAAIPDFVKPTLHQIAIQHPCWVGTIGWPKARERIIQYMDYTEYPQFAAAITRTFSINWQHGLNGIIEGHADQGYKLSEAFIKHVSNIENWTVGQELVDLFPFLQGAVNVQ